MRKAWTTAGARGVRRAERGGGPRVHPGRRLAWLALLLAACGQGGPSALNANTALTPTTHTFFPIATGVHAVDCNTCHGGFSSFAEFTCFNCHAHDQATTDPIHTGVNGYSYASTACYGCHANPTQIASPASVVHDAARDLTANALIPTYAGTSIASLSPQSETLVMGMDHATSELPGVNMASCAVCHAGAASGAYYPGTLHSSLANAQLPEPTACADCHTPSRPTGFVGPVAASPARTPPSGEMKHDAVAWADGVPTGTALVTSDCGTCHASPSATLVATWDTARDGTSPALFHASLTSASVPQPGSCLDCHANTRPSAVLTAGQAALPANVTFDHAAAPALADCASCHAESASSQWKSWTGGRFHLAGSATPSSCLPCHAGERPTSTAAWASTSYTASPFDYATNAAGVTHGDGQDCAVCHGGPGTGAWGGTQNWMGGHFTHGAATASGTTCIACHMSQRPDLQPGTTAAAMATLLGFDHSVNGTGDCIGCHQATVAAGSYVNYLNPATHALPGGDWKGGQTYPGATLVGSTSQSIAVTEIALVRTGANDLVTSTTSTTATLYNEMLHTSTVIPAEVSPGPAGAPDETKCWHCHTNANGTVTSFANGLFHASLANYAQTPTSAVTPLPEPTSQCSDCHASMRPVGIVEKAGSVLEAMDHRALFTATVTLGGVAVSGVAGMDCSLCHASPGKTWADGLFHASIGSAVPQDCTVCHYPLMANAASSNVTSGTNYRMDHASSQLTFQSCSVCHASALSRSTSSSLASTLWQTGTFHPNLAAQPGACADCHAPSEPAAGAPTQSAFVYGLALGSTSSNTAQWMNHGSSAVAGLDCARCHAADAKASGSAWSKSDSFHAVVPHPATCSECHGLANGMGSVVGTDNNMPAGLTNSSTATMASQGTGTGVPAGTLDQVSHADVNVTGHDCIFCHSQVGISTTPGIAGKEWAQALFHVSFTPGNPLVLSPTTGRCSDCHMNLKPGSAFTAQDHSSFTDVSGTEDCAFCHSWPGTGTTSAPNWLGATGVPQFITVGGFAIPEPPATTATIQTGISNLPHPTVTSTACATCHLNGQGGTGAIGYDHASTLIITNCNSCHEAGSGLVGTAWNGTTSQASGAGDTRPFTLPDIVATRGGGSSCTVANTNHFYPVDCAECHTAPTGVGTATTGTSYTNAFTFPHTTSKMTNPSTCNLCHQHGCDD